MIGQLLGEYELQQEIGRGPTATVYAARQHPVERYVALKLFDPQLREVAARLKQLYADVELLDHPNILPVYGNGRWQDHYYWVMRYMPAGSLKTRQRSQRLTLEEIDRLLPQVAAALDYAQQHGMFHGDLKSTDILLDHSGHAFVMDFGVAVALGRTTDSYQAPELRRGAAPDARTDVYCLGAILYELLAGRPPIDPRAPAEERTNRRIVPPAPSTVNSKVPGALDAVVLKALAVDPVQRYATPNEYVEAYAQARAGRSAASAVTAASVVEVATLSGMKVRRVSQRRAASGAGNRWRITGLIGGVIVGLIAIAAVILASSPMPAAAPRPTDTAAPTAANVPAAVPSAQPSDTPTIPPPTPTARPTSSPTVMASPTSTPSPAPAVVRRFATAAPTVSIAPLTLAIPRQEGRASLALTFRTNVQPPDAGIVGTLSLSIPPIESYVIDRTIAQVGSGEQVLQVAVAINCPRVAGPITTDQIVLTVSDATGKVLLTQPVDYTKRWCG